MDNYAERKDFDALKWLGRGVDMTCLTPFSFESVREWIKDTKVVNVQNDRKTHTVTIGGTTYTIPSIVSADNFASAGDTNKTFPSGDEALRSFQTGETGASELAVAANVSSYPLEKSLPSQYQFAFYSVYANEYKATLQEYLGFVDEKLFAKDVFQLPRPFSADNPSTVAAYTTFFRKWGTHVITGTDYGGRCNASTWASNQYREVNENWKKDVTAYLRGMNNRGFYEKSALEEPQYQIFRTIAQTLITVVGGSESLAEPIAQGDFDFAHLQKWLATVPRSPVLTSVKVTELWTILRGSTNSKIRDVATPVQEAFKAIVGRSEKECRSVTTLVVFTCDSGSAELGLLSPGTIVGVGGPLPAFDPTTQNVIGLSENKIRLGNSGERRKERVTVFYIVNDGTPIDISISRDVGKACAIINGESYSNDTKAVVKFYKVPILRETDPRV
ncbi:hypothetical protein PQX77_017330 [Marasmius sp. AFHP31]|nr:hypothetical protein PQX77_017330 [Marasmius sp. AFHP31]